MADLGWLLLLTLAAWGIGDTLVDRLKLPPTSIRGASALVLGLAILSYLVLSLGGLGMLRPGLLRVLVIGLASWGLARVGWAVRRQRISCPSRPGFLAGALVVLFAVTILISLLATLDPPTPLDLTHYHLRVPIFWLEHNRVTWPFKDLPYHYPQGMEILFALGLALGNSCMPQLLHFLTALATLWGVVSFARVRWGGHAALLAGLFYWSIPEVHYLATIPFVDLAWTGAEVLAVLAFVEGLDLPDSRKGLRWWALVGALAGWAAAIKYAALLTVLLLGLGAIWVSLTTVPWHERWNHALRTAGVYTVSAFVVAGFWYIKNWLYFGNPVYPFVWGGRGLAPEDAQTWMAFLYLFGPSRSLWRFLRLPWDIFMTQHIPSMRPGLFPYPIALVPLLWVLSRWGRVAKVFVIFFVAYLTAWYWAGTQQLRFILAPMTLTCLLAAQAGSEVMRSKESLAIIVSFLLFISLALGIWLQWQALAVHILPHASADIFRPELLPRW